MWSLAVPAAGQQLQSERRTASAEGGRTGAAREGVQELHPEGVQNLLPGCVQNLLSERVQEKSCYKRSKGVQELTEGGQESQRACTQEPRGVAAEKWTEKR